MLEEHLQYNLITSSVTAQLSDARWFTLPLGDPQFKFDEWHFDRMLLTYADSEGHGQLQGYEPWETFGPRMNKRPPLLPFEVKSKLEWYVKYSALVMLEATMLDTAIGHHLLDLAGRYGKVSWAVGVDNVTSPLAPAYLKGILFPTTAQALADHIDHEVVLINHLWDQKKALKKQNV